MCDSKLASKPQCDRIFKVVGKRKQFCGYTGGNPAKSDFLLRRAVDQFINSEKQYTYPKEVGPAKGILSITEQFKPYRDLFVDYLENMKNHIIF